MMMVYDDVSSAVGAKVMETAALQKQTSAIFYAFLDFDVIGFPVVSCGVMR